MSYSRWSNSPWYSFWNSSSGEEIEDQVLSLWLGGDSNNLDFTYSELYEFTSEDFKNFYLNITDDEISKGLEIIKIFIEDVNEDFYRDKK